MPGDPPEVNGLKRQPDCGVRGKEGEMACGLGRLGGLEGAFWRAPFRFGPPPSPPRVRLMSEVRSCELAFSDMG